MDVVEMTGEFSEFRVYVGALQVENSYFIRLRITCRDEVS